MSNPTDALQAWVASTLNITAVWLNPNAPRPQRPYATLQAISRQRVGSASAGHPNADGDATITGDREVTLSVQYIGAADSNDPRNGYQELQALVDSLERPSVIETLDGSGWAFIRTALLQDITAQVGTQWEPRAVVDIEFRAAATQTDQVGVVDTVKLESTLTERTEPLEVTT